MSRTFSYTACVGFGDPDLGADCEITVDYGVDWGCPGSRETPPESPEVIDVEITDIDGKPWAEHEWGWAGRTREEAAEHIIDRLIDQHQDTMLEIAGSVVADEIGGP